ncbi:MAG: signal peptidase I [Cyanobacteria bacterium]|nr:signal peptidase I [Cyanobacteriota bacterium]MDA0866175.1 signal peptidase I [Cyanobacteriota bacterium]
MRVATQPRYPHPWLAANCSLVFPGLGQLYRGQLVKGSAMAIATGSLVSFLIWSIFSADGNTVQGLWAIASLLILYGWSIVDALRGYGTNAASALSVSKPTPLKSYDPWYTAFLSQVLPGLGHLYLQRVGIGSILLLLGIVSALLTQSYPTLLPIPVVIWAFGCYHGYHMALTNRQRSHPLIWLVVVGMLVLRLTVGSIPAWVNQTVEQCIVPSRSMVPTLQINDRLFVRHQANYVPQLGDVVVFEAPTAAQNVGDIDAGTLMVKRVIALPGQTLQISNGQVWVNQQPLTEPYIAAAPNYEWGPSLIPADQFFVLGDNRNASSDSHVWGFLAADLILGRAYKIYWPPSRISALG